MTGHAFTDELRSLIGVQFTVPKEIERPQSALDFDRKGGMAIDMELQNQREYWLARNAKYKSMGESRKNGKRNDARSEAA